MPYQYKWYEQEGHGTIALSALYDGLKFIFKGFLVEFKDLYPQPIAITNGYQQFSKHVHPSFSPSQQKQNFMINYFQENKKADQENHSGIK